MVTRAMFEVRVLASRAAWVAYSSTRDVVALRRYERLLAYECHRNGTTEYTPVWMLTP